MTESLQPFSWGFSASLFSNQGNTGYYHAGLWNQTFCVWIPAQPISSLVTSSKPLYLCKSCFPHWWTEDSNSVWLIGLWGVLELCWTHPGVCDRVPQYPCPCGPLPLNVGETCGLLLMDRMWQMWRDFSDVSKILNHWALRSLKGILSWVGLAQSGCPLKKGAGALPEVRGSKWQVLSWWPWWTKSPWAL